ncbi:TAXI family TRAP transporter solute-binding subunit [Aeromonas dhakensis]|uniref:TAXI family TRAP transporter solute-binding subunit n=1 Tax=Aeromonas dhakensis TaxID=196024 RepID=UPI002157B137|nr:TAXI family TRAP transporter solute-binding subunit [Aeromonas dhakensis]MCR6740513.1 TAXI family TRAP transporter solute-binding subunit [Aeromonas dhakensis]
MFQRVLHLLPIRLRRALPWLAATLALPLQAATYLTIGTGPLNGVYYPTGGAICRLLNEESGSHGLHCSVQSTSGSLANLKALAQGNIQLALVQSDVLHHAAHGTGPFQGQPPADQLRSLYRLHQESLTLLASANSNINTLADIEGKRVDLGNPGSGERVTSQALLDAMGWQAKSFAPLIPAAANNRLEGLCDGTLDAAFVVAGHPNQAIGDLTGRCKARLIPIEGEQIDRLLKQHPYYQRGRIGANLYPGQTSGINTFAVTAELVALASLPDSEVRTVRDVLSGRLKQFTRLHPALTQLTLEGMLGEAEVPRHAGMADAPPTLLPESLSPAPATSEALATSAAQPTEVAHTAGEEAKQPAGETGAPSPKGTPATSSGLTPGALLPTPSAAAATEQGGTLTGTAAPSPSAVMSGAQPASPAPAEPASTAPPPAAPSGASPTAEGTPAQ